MISIGHPSFISFQVPSQLEKISSYYSDIAQIALPAAAGMYAFYQCDYQGILWLATSLIVNQLGIEIIKRLTQVQRPNGAQHAFPSGHTAAAFLGPFFLMRKYSLSPAYPLVAVSFIAATLTGIGRILNRAHWVQDVVGGVALAFAVCLIVPSR